MSNDNNLGQRISIIKEYFKLNATKLGEIANVSGQTVTDIEKGSVPKVNIIIEIATKLEIKLDWLLLGKGEMLMNTNNPTTNNNNFNGNGNTNSNSSIYSEKNDGVINAPVTINSLATELEILKQKISMMSEQLEDAKTQIKEKDSQIREKDSQISKLLDKIIK